MKGLTVPRIISFIVIAILLVFLISPNAKAWLSQGLMKMGLFKPDLTYAQADAASAEQEPLAARAPRSVYFQDGEGNRIDAANLQGKVVFINFWATWCPPCIAEMPSINKLYDVYKENEDVVFIIADVDNKYEQSVQFMEDKNLTLPVHVPAGEVPGDWLGGAIPTTVILDKTGAIAARHEGMADYSRKEVVDFIQNLIDE